MNDPNIYNDLYDIEFMETTDDLYALQQDPDFLHVDPVTKKVITNSQEEDDWE